MIIPQWPKPHNVQAYTITRNENYQSVIPQDPYWLTQVHGTHVIPVNKNIISPHADGSWTQDINQVCVIKTADCLPVLLCDEQGTCVAAIHAGWRGLAAGILEQGVKQLPVLPKKLLAWLGPAISSEFYEVGPEVRQAFLNSDPQAAVAFHPSQKENHWYMDLYLLARQSLQKAGLKSIFGGEYCTYRDTTQFYSYRRDQTSQRLISLIWISELAKKQ